MRLIGKYNSNFEVKFDVELSYSYRLPLDILYGELVNKMSFDIVGNYYNEDIIISETSLDPYNFNHLIEPYIRYLETLGSIRFNGYGSYKIINYDLYKINIRDHRKEIVSLYNNLDYYIREFILENLP